MSFHIDPELKIFRKRQTGNRQNFLWSLFHLSLGTFYWLHKIPLKHFLVMKNSPKPSRIKKPIRIRPNPNPQTLVLTPKAEREQKWVWLLENVTATGCCDDRKISFNFSLLEREKCVELFPLFTASLKKQLLLHASHRERTRDKISLDRVIQYSALLRKKYILLTFQESFVDLKGNLRISLHISEC